MALCNRPSHRIVATVASLVVGIGLSGNAPAIAQVVDQGAQLVIHNGQRGMWFPMSSARKLLKDIKLHEATKSTLRVTEQRLTLEKRRAELVHQNQTDTEQIAKLWQATAKQQAKILEQKAAWWKSPHLWIVIGFTAGVVTTIGLTFAVSRSGMIE